ncbi:hypothetical protein SAMN02745181_2867 [Rubritalea squalenifaciens DSM 18772]|uniref:Uncharacterized protein n=1 Tax=Rubritalea squalenifaciens DSM 18772 TaxID=1123071 RepID=A0A1M6NII7_9BACT|nr:hypothetical protein [Rubritalea squalenifaciens]SHJ95500.1 hypothetical protein SAMN02745181_2867 [Rubritalea squalenifaciens DSM 18772]
MFRWILNKLKGRPDVTQAGTAPGRVSIDLTFEELHRNYDIRTSEFKGLSLSSIRQEARLAHWIGASDYSGFIRERSLRFIIDHFQEGDEERIMLRLSDWVPQISSIASDWIIANFNQLPLSAIYANQRIILYLSRKARVVTKPAYKVIQRDVLERVSHLDEECFFKFDLAFRKYLYKLSMNGDQKLRPWMMSDSDPRNRLLLLNLIGECDRLTDTEVAAFESDRSALVRRRYLYYLLSQGKMASEDFLWSMALHKSKGLRDLGRYYLEKEYQRDVYAKYAGLSGESFYYIADYERASDLDVFVRGVREGCKRTRMLCLQAIVNLEPKRILELSIHDLLKASGSEKFIVYQVLPDLLTLEELRSYREDIESASPSGCEHYMNMIGRKSFWAFVCDGLDYLIKDTSESSVRSLVFDTIQRKNSIFEQLSSELEFRIQSKLEELENSSKGEYSKWIEHVRFILKNALS